MDEIWKDISGYEGLYQVSNLGRVKSLERIIYSGRNYSQIKLQKEKILKGKRDKDGYIEYTLACAGKTKYIRGHRIVALHFIKKDADKNFVNHINGIKSDNSVDNLEWCTSSENALHSLYKLNNIKTQNRSGLNKGIKVICINHNDVKITIYKSIRNASLNHKLCESTVKRLCDSNLNYNDLEWRYLL